MIRESLVIKHWFKVMFLDDWQKKKNYKSLKNMIKGASRLTYKPCVNTSVTMKEGLFISSFMATPLLILLYILFC